MIKKLLTFILLYDIIIIDKRKKGSYPKNKMCYASQEKATATKRTEEKYGK